MVLRSRFHDPTLHFEHQRGVVGHPRMGGYENTHLSSREDVGFVPTQLQMPNRISLAVDQNVLRM